LLAILLKLHHLFYIFFLFLLNFLFWHQFFFLGGGGGGGVERSLLKKFTDPMQFLKSLTPLGTQDTPEHFHCVPS